MTNQARFLSADNQASKVTDARQDKAKFHLDDVIELTDSDSSLELPDQLSPMVQRPKSTRRVSHATRKYIPLYADTSDEDGAIIIMCVSLMLVSNSSEDRKFLVLGMTPRALGSRYLFLLRLRMSKDNSSRKQRTHQPGLQISLLLRIFCLALPVKNIRSHLLLISLHQHHPDCQRKRGKRRSRPRENNMLQIYLSSSMALSSMVAFQRRRN